MRSHDAGSENPLPAEELFDRVHADHCQALHAFFFGRTGDPEAALDLCQETFLRAWRSLPTLQGMPPDQHRYWLFAVARNLLTDQYRRRLARSAAETRMLAGSDRSVGSPQDAVLELIQQEELAAVDEAIRNLPAELRTVLAMKVLGEMSSREIGEALGTPAGTVRYQLSVARRQLAAALRHVDSESRERADER